MKTTDKKPLYMKITKNGNKINKENIEKSCYLR